MTYVFLQILNTNAQPSIPTLAAASFILRLKESKFFEILGKIAKIILGTKVNNKNQEK